MTRPSLARFLQRSVRILQTALTFAEFARSRRALRQLDDHLLRDIGLTRHEAEALASQPFRANAWDAPPHWRQAQSQRQSHLQLQSPPKACAIPACSA